MLILLIATCLCFMGIVLDNPNHAIGEGGATAILVIISFFLGLIPATIAYKKGRGFYTWWIYGFYLFIIALIHSLVIKETDAAKIANGYKKCPYCAELIKKGECKIVCVKSNCADLFYAPYWGKQLKGWISNGKT